MRDSTRSKRAAALRTVVGDFPAVDIELGNLDTIIGMYTGDDDALRAIARERLREVAEYVVLGMYAECGDEARDRATKAHARFARARHFARIEYRKRLIEAPDAKPGSVAGEICAAIAKRRRALKLHETPSKRMVIGWIKDLASPTGSRRGAPRMKIK